MRFPRSVVLSVLVPVVVALTFGLAGATPATAALPSHAAGPHDHGSPVLQLVGTILPGVTGDHSTHVAAQALQNAQKVFAHKTPQQAQHLIDSGRDATPVLTNLFRHRDELSRSDRKVAARVLARPGGRSRICNTSAKICVHYSTTGDDRSTPAWANKVLSVVSHVAGVYHAAGFRRPVGDGTTGGHRNFTDVYIANIGPQGYYGYCTPESGRYVATGYCVLDNDYAHSEFPTNRTPTQDLEVTAAHEFFHDVQFAYDVNEDLWFMEATAVWAEDQLYTDINDNRQYLPFGQLRTPRTPLDHSRNVFRDYGNWIFFRYLTEHLPKRKGPLPSIMLEMWRQAAVSANRKHNKHSVQAIASALSARGRSLKSMYAGFAAANLHPKISYREGRSTHYPVAKVAGVRTLKPAKRSASGHYTVAHLSSATERFRPHNVTRKRHLRVAAHVPKRRLQVAIVAVYRKHRTVTHRLRLNAKGNGHITVAFASARVIKVELTLVNTAHTYVCSKGTDYPCQGKPTVDGLKDTWSARLV